MLHLGRVRAQAGSDGISAGLLLQSRILASIPKKVVYTSYPLGQVVPNPVTLKTKAHLPALTGFRVQPFATNRLSKMIEKEFGYYPYSEMGSIVLESNFDASASIRLDIAGNYRAKAMNFGGRWKADALGKQSNSVSDTIVLMLATRIGRTELTFDFLIGFVSPSENSIMAAGQRPRPVIATGRMWRTSAVAPPRPV